MNDSHPKKFGKYLLLDQIAVGGMAELYRAKIVGDQGFQKLIAIKKLLPHLVQEENLVKSFIDEAKLAAFLQHQNIIQIYDFGSLEGSYFLAMEYLFGKDLQTIMKTAGERGRPLGLDNTLHIISRVCAGLDYAHTLKDFQGKPLNIIHRDISPQNILVTYGGEVKIIDFGIAKAASQSEKTQVGTLKGKVAYMSPEQADGKPLDRRSDVFAAGILLYEMVTERRMFQGDTLEVLAQVREARFDPPERVARDLPEPVCRILHRALAREPDERYQSSGEMLSDLDNCVRKLACPQTSHGLAQTMRTLFEDEIQTEEINLREITDTDRRPEQGVVGARPGRHVKTAPLSRGEMPLDKKTKWPRYGAMAAGSVVVLGILLALILGYHGSDTRIDRSSADTPKQSPESPTPQGTVSGVPAVPASPPEPTALEKAMAALQEERFTEAAFHFDQALSQDPGIRETMAVPYAEALQGQAKPLVKTRPREAESLLRKALEMDPDSVRANFQLGLVYVSLKDYPRAIERYEKVARIDPQFADTFFNLGYIYAMKKDYDKSEEMYKRVVDLAPMYLDEALFNLAMVQEKSGKLKESLLNLQQAVTVNPENTLAIENLERVKKKTATR